ncbi:uncharacterized protein TNCV_660781 [Trichonephila clavipes]|nr:uncharacterized protein TNCV_660781 [Trichonephila clavipes]
MSEISHMLDLLRWRTVGWMKMGCPSLMLLEGLNVSRSGVHRLRNQHQTESICVQKTRSRPTTSYNTCRRSFYRSFGPKEKKHFYVATRCRPLCSIRENNILFYGAKATSQFRSVCKATNCVGITQRMTEKGPLILTREPVSYIRQKRASVPFTDESIFPLESHSRRLFIWR